MENKKSKIEGIERKRTPVPETDFEKNYHLSASFFSNLEGLKGFELYKKYRDGFLKLIAKEEYIHLSLGIQKSFDDISSFQFVDQAYLDNFMICLALQLGNPKAYEEFSSTVDTYIKPDKRSAGLQYLNKELACLFVHVLNIYAGISTRQATNISRQAFSISESEIKSRISKIKQKFSDWEKDKLPSKIVLAFLFCYIAYQDINWDKIKSVSPHTKLTKKSHAQAVNSYRELRNRITGFYIQENIAFMKKYPDGLHNAIEDDPNPLRFDTYDLDNINDKQLALILGYSVCIDLMPNFLIEPELFMKK